MQKKALEFIKDAINKMRDWWVSWIKLWLKSLLEYTIIFFVVVLVGHVVSSMANIVYFRYPFDDFGYPFNFSYPRNEIFRHSFNVTTNLTINNATTMYADNARSILCTLVESEAAIVAIVVSLTLIAIQFTASEYSPRVIDISLRNPDMWLLLLIYGMSIFYGLLLIKQVPHDSWMLFEDVSFAFWLGVFSYVALVPYIRNISNLLKPENIIKKLAIKITSKKILNEEEGQIQPIMDIIRASIMKYDFETMRVGLIELSNRVIKVIDSESAKKISTSFCDHLKGIGKFAISRTDEESTKQVIEKLKDFGEFTTKEQFKQGAEQVAMAIGTVGGAAAKNQLKDATWQAISSLEVVGKNAVENKLDGGAFRVVSSLEAVGKTAVDEGKVLKVEIEQAALSLEAIGKAAAEEATKGDNKGNELGNVINRDVLALKNIGEAAAKNILEDVIPQVVLSLVAVGKTAADKGEELGDATKKAAKYLAELTFLSKKIVETTIFNYELNLKGADSSFQKFKCYYEQELEKMKASVSE